MKFQFLLVAAIVTTGLRLQAVDLQPQTLNAFNRYVELTETELKQRLRPDRFLWMDEHPRDKSRLWLGQPMIFSHETKDGGHDIEIPNGLVQDWMGAMFLPGVRLEKVRTVLQDYPNYKVYFKPEVIESRLDKREGDRFNVFLRLSEKQLLTVVLNTTYSVEYATLDPTRMYVTSRSTHIGEVKNPKKKKYDEEQAPGDEFGLLWRINSYWRFQEADNGVYAELQAVSLSRDVPLGLGFLLKGFLQQFPKQSMENTMQGLRQAVGVH